MTKIFRDKKSIVAIAIAMMTAVIVLICSSTTYAAAQNLQATGYISPREGAILRSGTSTSTKKLAGIKYNSKVTITGEVFVSKTSTKSTNVWYQVVFNKRKGYVRGDLVKNIKYSHKKGIATDNLYYRVGPGKTMKRAGMFKKGTALDIVSEARMQGSKQLWYKIKKGNKYYYSCAEWISFANQKNTSTATKETNKTENKQSSDVIVNNTVKDATFPTKLGQGSPFYLKGKVSSTGNITEGTVKVFNSGGKIVLSAKRSGSGNTFDIATVDAEVKFGKLGIGNYKYVVEVKVAGKTYTVLNKSFTVVKAKKAEAIANKAMEIAWPLGTSSKKYSYKTGYPTRAYKQALNSAYPDRSRWGAPPRAGASCDVFTGTVIRSSGVDKNVPRGLQEQFPYFKNSKKWTRVAYNGSKDVLRNGDVILYYYNGGAHILIYVKKNGHEYVVEANYNRTYGMVSDGYAVKERLNTKGKKHYIYRIIE